VFKNLSIHVFPNKLCGTSILTLFRTLDQARTDRRDILWRRLKRMSFQYNLLVREVILDAEHFFLFIRALYASGQWSSSNARRFGSVICSVVKNRQSWNMKSQEFQLFSPFVSGSRGSSSCGSQQAQARSRACTMVLLCLAEGICSCAAHIIWK
jgi:hypothetical protein